MATEKKDVVEKEVKKNDLVKVRATEKAKYIKTGRVTELHKVQAEKLAKLGYVEILK